MPPVVRVRICRQGHDDVECSLQPSLSSTYLKMMRAVGGTSPRVDRVVVAEEGSAQYLLDHAVWNVFCARTEASDILDVADELYLRLSADDVVVYVVITPTEVVLYEEVARLAKQTVDALQAVLDTGCPEPFVVAWQKANTRLQRCIDALQQEREAMAVQVEVGGEWEGGEWEGKGGAGGGGEQYDDEALGVYE